MPSFWTQALLSNLRKQSLVCLLQNISGMQLLFHSKLSVIVMPWIFTWFKRSKSKPLIVIGAKDCLIFLKSNISSLHLSTFSWSLLQHHQRATESTASWMPLTSSFRITSARLVSLTYFHVCTSQELRSLNMRTNSQGTSLVPWSAPDGAGHHSEKQLFESFTRCCLSKISQTQPATPHGIWRDKPLLTSVWWSIKSNAFL